VESLLACGKRNDALLYSASFLEDILHKQSNSVLQKLFFESAVTHRLLAKTTSDFTSAA
jgi:hypothetical protein